MSKNVSKGRIGRAAAFKKQKFGPFCDRWLLLNRDRVKESTYVKYENILRKHIEPQLGSFLLQELSSLVIQQFSHELLHKKQLSPKTVRDILTLLREILRYATMQYPGAFPQVDILYPKVPKKEMRVLTRQEQVRLTEYLLTDTDVCKFGVLLCLCTGMRIGEICALKWADISLTEKVLRVHGTMQRLRNAGGQGTKVVITEPKSNHSVRVIPLTDSTAALCESFASSCPEAFVLTGETHRFVEPRVLQYRLGCYTRACGLEGVHFHTLRHTFATRCVEVDFEIKSLSEILGHSSPRITLERYVHSSMELKRSNMEKLTAVGF